MMLCMNRMILSLHVASVLAAYSVFDLSYLVLPRTTNISSQRIAVVSAVVILAGTACLTGFLLMIRRPGESESIALAVSTVAAFLLLALAL
jgi:hypothetical protein